MEKEGFSDIDLILTTKGTPETQLRVHGNVIESNHRLITFVVAEPPKEPMRFRNHRVLCDHFEARIHGRVYIKWNLSSRV